MPNIIRHFASNANIRGDFSSTYTKPPFRALHPPRHHQTPAMRASFPISKYVTSASGRCQFPLSKYTTSASGRCLLPISIYGDGGGRQAGGEVYPSPSSPARIAVVHRSPSPNIPHLPAADVYSPSPTISHLPAADVYSPSPFMERGWPIGRGVRSPHAIIP